MNNLDPQKAISSLYNINIHDIRYLGKGSDAIVREGCVLLPPTDEYQHFLMRTALWVYISTQSLDQCVVRRKEFIDGAFPRWIKTR